LNNRDFKSQRDDKEKRKWWDSAETSELFGLRAVLKLRKSYKNYCFLKECI
jgi:hypothetical protein